MVLLGTTWKSNVTGQYPNYICPLEEDPRRCYRAKAVLTHTMKAGFVADVLCKMSYLFLQPWSPIYLSPTSHYGEAWSKPWMLAASHRAGWWGLSRLLFVCTLEPLFILKHVLQGSNVALIVWSERALLSPESDIMRVSTLHMIYSSLKQDTWNSRGLKLWKTQGWFVGTRGSAPSGAARVARVMCFRAQEIDPESVHSQPENQLSSLIIHSTYTEADFEWLHLWFPLYCHHPNKALPALFFIFRQYLLENLIT